MDSTNSPRERVPIQLPYVPVVMPPDEPGMSDEEFSAYLERLRPLVESGQFSDTSGFSLADEAI